MKKALIFGSVFGLIFGIIELLTLGFNLSELYVLTGIVSLLAYIVCLIFVLRQPGTQSYSQRFLNGFIFSIMLGTVYGIIAGIAGFVFAENVAQLSRDGVELLGQLGLEENLTSELETTTSPQPLGNLFGEIVRALLFNAIFGAIFSSIFASFIRPAKTSDAAETKE